MSVVKGTFTQAEYPDIQEQFTLLLSLNNASEYQPDLMEESSAKNAQNAALTWDTNSLGNR